MGTIFVWVVGLTCVLVMSANYGPWDEGEYIVVCLIAAMPAALLNLIVVRVVHDPEWQQSLWSILLLASMRLMLTTYRDEAFSGARQRIKPVAERYSKVRAAIVATLPQGDFERLEDIKIGMSKHDFLAKLGDRWRIVESNLGHGFENLTLWDHNSIDSNPAGRSFLRCRLKTRTSRRLTAFVVRDRAEFSSKAGDADP